MPEGGPELAAPERIKSGEFSGAVRLGAKDETEVYWYVPNNQVVETAMPETTPVDAETHRLSE